MGTSSPLPQAVTGPGGTFSGWSVGGLRVLGLAVQAQDILTHLKAQTFLFESHGVVVEAQVLPDFPSG